MATPLAPSMLQSPPVFNGPNCPGPLGQPDWAQFYRWLLNLFRAVGTTALIQDTHVNRINYSASIYKGFEYWETDRKVLYISNGVTWYYVLGTMTGSLGELPVLGVEDAGFLFFEDSQYFHQLEWAGNTWRRGPGDLDHSDTFADFGDIPTDGGWHACDGSTVTYLIYNGTEGSRILPNLATPAYAKQGASYSDTVTAATAPTASAPTFTGTAASATGATAGAVSVVAAPYTPAGSVSAPVITLPGDPMRNYPVIRMYRK